MSFDQDVRLDVNLFQEMFIYTLVWWIALLKCLMNLELGGLHNAQVLQHAGPKTAGMSQRSRCAFDRQPMRVELPTTQVSGGTWPSAAAWQP
jgi:hypothetical protein